GPATTGPVEAMQSGAFDRHEADLPGVAGTRNVVDGHACRPVALLGLLAGMIADGALVVVLLVGELGLREHVLVVDDEKLVLRRLQLERPGIMRRCDISDGLRLPGVAHVNDAEALGEDMADIGEALVDHDLDTVASPALVAVADQLEVGSGIVGFGKITAHRCLERKIAGERPPAVLAPGGRGLRDRAFWSLGWLCAYFTPQTFLYWSR